jgi:hypothetical protein
MKVKIMERVVLVGVAKHFIIKNVTSKSINIILFEIQNVYKTTVLSHTDFP